MQSPHNRLKCTQRWTAPDGTVIAYDMEGPTGPREEGREGPALVLSNGLTTNTAFWRYLHPRWTRSHRVLRWDLPGHGASGPARSKATATIAEQPEIIAGLMDAVGIATAVQIGWSTGCQVALEMVRRYPARCVGLVLLLGSAGRVLSTTTLPLPGSWLDNLARRTPPTLFNVLARTMAFAAAAPLGDRLPRRLGLIGRNTCAEDAASITQHLRTIDTHTVQAMIASAHAHSAWEFLPEIRLPVLIVSADLDPFAPAEPVGTRMHAMIPTSDFVRLPEGTHTALFDHAEVIAGAVDRFFMRVDR